MSSNSFNELEQKKDIMIDTTFENLLAKETDRQQQTFSLIASENHASLAVRQAMGSVLCNKYSEGQVGKRYYQGNQFIDQIEALCKTRALEAFGLDATEWGVNVQALSGSQANLAVYNALLKPGDTILSMYLPDGGHLSHGWELPHKKISIVSSIYKVSHYKTDKDSLVFDYDQIEAQAKVVKPAMIISGGTAYPRTIDHERLAAIAKKVGAYYLSDIAHEAGLVAAGVHDSPFAYADVVTMTTHKTLRGPRGAMIFGRKRLIKDSKSSLIDAIDFSVFPGIQGGPHNEIIGALAVALGEVATPAFRAYAKQVVVNAKLLAQSLVEKGYTVVTGGTDKHLLLLDLRPQGLVGRVVALALEQVGIITNANTVPHDTASPLYPSGLRLGTPAVTTRGFGQKEIETLADSIDTVIRIVGSYSWPESGKALSNALRDMPEKLQKDEKIQAEKIKISKLAERFPVPDAPLELTSKQN